MFCILIFVKRLPVSSRVWSNNFNQDAISTSLKAIVGPDVTVYSYFSLWGIISTPQQVWISLNEVIVGLKTSLIIFWNPSYLHICYRHKKVNTWSWNPQGSYTMTPWPNMYVCGTQPILNALRDIAVCFKGILKSLRTISEHFGKWGVIVVSIFINVSWGKLR